MTPAHLLALAINPALSLLPERMTSDPARAMLIAIALQESSLKHRAQIGGPARGLWQFEQIGVSGVQHHHTTAEYSVGADRTFLYRPESIYSAIEHNDVLAACYARLLLWQCPDRLPSGRMDQDEGWRQYMKMWRPGKPHPSRWADNWRAAWAGL